MFYRTIPVLIVLGLLLGFAGRSFGDDPHDQCVNLSTRTLAALIRTSADLAVKRCPQAPDCVCPSLTLPTRFVVCRQNWKGTITRCKRIAIKPLSE